MANETELIHQVIRGYRVESYLAAGGMTLVYKAVHEGLDRTVALKMVRPEHIDDPQSIRRLQYTSKLQGRLRHPNIVIVYDFFEENIDGESQKFMIEEFVEGGDLDHKIQQQGKLSPLEAVRICKQVLRGLHEAHKAKVIHRDIKPANVLVDKEGRAKITDFGIAKEFGGEGMNLTQTGGMIGTGHYMSPEQITSPRNIDHRTDIYSTAVMLYELLTGHLPFEKETETYWTLIKAQVSEPPPPFEEWNINLPPELERIIFTALEKKPDNRFKDAEEFAKTLEQVEELLEKEDSEQNPIKARLVVAEAHLKTGDFEKAQQLYEHILMEDPDNTQCQVASRELDIARQVIALVNKAQEHLQANRFDEFKNISQQVNKYLEQFSHLRGIVEPYQKDLQQEQLKKVNALYREGKLTKNKGEAIACFQRCLKLDPDFKSAREALKELAEDVSSSSKEESIHNLATQVHSIHEIQTQQQTVPIDAMKTGQIHIAETQQIVKKGIEHFNQQEYGKAEQIFKTLPPSEQNQSDVKTYLNYIQTMHTMETQFQEAQQAMKNGDQKKTEQICLNLLQQEEQANTTFKPHLENIKSSCKTTLDEIQTPSKKSTSSKKAIIGIAAIFILLIGSVLIWQGMNKKDELPEQPTTPTPSPTIAKTANLSFNISEIVMDVAITGENTILSGKSNQTFNLSAGTYQIRCTAPDYEDHEETITLKPGETLKVSINPVPFTPQSPSEPEKPKLAKLGFKSDVNMQVYIDGVLKGTTQGTFSLEEGTYQIRCKKDGYEDIMFNNVYLAADNSKKLTLHPVGKTKKAPTISTPDDEEKPTTTPGILQVQLTGAVGKIYVDDKLLPGGDRVYELTTKLSPGKHLLKIYTPPEFNYAYQEKITIASADIKEVNIKLKKIRLIIKSRNRPPYRVKIDGSVFETKPDSELYLPVGDHTFEVIGMSFPKKTEFVGGSGEQKIILGE